LPDDLTIHPSAKRASRLDAAAMHFLKRHFFKQTVLQKPAPGNSAAGR
jgi:hypothetical protein